MTEEDLFILEAAEQHGFVPPEEGGEIYSVRPEAIIAMVKAARRQGREDMEQCQGCNAPRTEGCRRGAPGACFRLYHGQGTYEALPEGVV